MFDDILDNSENEILIELPEDELEEDEEIIYDDQLLPTLDEVEKVLDDFFDYQADKGMPCGCLNHGVYTWEMPCPLWREKVDFCIQEWHDDIHNRLPEYLPEYLHQKLGITEEMFIEWTKDPLDVEDAEFDERQCSKANPVLEGHQDY